MYVKLCGYGKAAPFAVTKCDCVVPMAGLTMSHITLLTGSNGIQRCPHGQCHCTWASDGEEVVKSSTARS